MSTFYDIFIMFSSQYSTNNKVKITSNWCLVFYVYIWCYLSEELSIWGAHHPWQSPSASSTSPTSGSLSRTTSAIALILASSPSFTLRWKILRLEMSSGNLFNLNIWKYLKIFENNQVNMGPSSDTKSRNETGISTWIIPKCGVAGRNRAGEFCLSWPRSGGFCWHLPQSLL